MTTRSYSNEMFAHFLDNVLQLQPTNAIRPALQAQQISTVEDIMSMSFNDIDNLSFTTDDGNDQQLHRSSKALIKALQSFIRYQVSLNNWNYLSLSSEQFGRYRIELYDPNSNNNTLPSRLLNNRVPTKTPAEAFKQSIKRDKAHYSSLKQDKQWDQWRRSTIATARAHGCDEIFASQYTPSNAEESDLFVEKQKFIYSVFEESILTDIGKYYVRLHEKDYDAQEIF